MISQGYVTKQIRELRELATTGISDIQEGEGLKQAELDFDDIVEHCNLLLADLDGALYGKH